MHRQLRVVVLGAVAFAAVAGTRVVAAEEPFDSLPRFLTVRPRYGDGRLIALDIVALRQRSATFRAALALLESHQRVRVLVAPVPVRQADGMFGRTTFGMGAVELVAAIDVFVDERSQARTLEALGHEFGHVRGGGVSARQRGDHQGAGCPPQAAGQADAWRWCGVRDAVRRSPGQGRGA